MNERHQMPPKTMKEDLDHIVETELSNHIEVGEGFTKTELNQARVEFSDIEGLEQLDDKKLLAFIDQYTAGQGSAQEIVSSLREKKPEATEAAAALAEISEATVLGVAIDDPEHPEIKVSLATKLGFHLDQAKNKVITGIGKTWNRIPFEKLPRRAQGIAKLGAAATAIAGAYGAYRYGMGHAMSGLLGSEAQAAQTPQTGSTANNPLLNKDFSFGFLTTPKGTHSRELIDQAHEAHAGNRMVSSGVTEKLADVKHGRLTGGNLDTFREDITKKSGRRAEVLANERFKMMHGNDADTYRQGIDQIHGLTEKYLTPDGKHLSKAGERAYEHFSRFVEHARVEKVSADEAIRRGFNVNAGIKEGHLKSGLDDRTVIGGTIDRDVYILTGKNAKGQTIQLAVKENCYNLLSKQPYIPTAETPVYSTPPTVTDTPPSAGEPNTPSHRPPHDEITGGPGPSHGPRPEEDQPRPRPRPEPTTPVQPGPGGEPTPTPETPTTPNPKDVTESPTQQGNVPPQATGPNEGPSTPIRPNEAPPETYNPPAPTVDQGPSSPPPAESGTNGSTGVNNGTVTE